MKNNFYESKINAGVAVLSVMALFEPAFSYGQSPDENVGALPSSGRTIMDNNAIQDNKQQKHVISSNKLPRKKNDNNNIDNSPDTIVVTGSHIQGVDTSVGNQVIILGQKEIREAGFSTARDIFENLPQNFGGGATGELQNNTESNLNLGQGSTINLRGLGSTATLVLLNGRRLPAGGFNNTAVDISFIPMSAIERIEVLPDGASAIYGSDAVAGVVNFILKKDYDGADTRLRYGSATSSSYDDYQISQLFGRSWESGSILVTYEYTYRDRLRADDMAWAKTENYRRHTGIDNRLPFSMPGNILDPRTFSVLYAIPPGLSSGTVTLSQLLPAEQAHLTDQSTTLDLMPKQKQHSSFLSLQEKLNENIESYIEAHFSHRRFSLRSPSNFVLLQVPSSNPYYIDILGNGEPFYVGYSFNSELPSSSKGRVKNYGAAGRLSFLHPADWQTDVDIAVNREDTNQSSVNAPDFEALEAALATDNPLLALNPFVDGMPASSEVMSFIFPEEPPLRLKSIHYQGQLVANGPLFRLRDEYIRLALGGNYREENFERIRISNNSVDRVSFKRKVQAVFGELFVPIFGENDGLPGLRKLELSASIRYERYKDKGSAAMSADRGAQSSTDPRLGILWSPVEGLSFRGSYGTSFRAPGLYTLAQINSINASALPDPQSVAGRTYTLVISGARPLENETAKTWTLGVDYANSAITAVRARASVFHISFKDQVATPFASDVFNDPSLAFLITRNPNLAQIQAACLLAPEERRQVGNADCTTEGVVQAIVDARTANFSRTKIEGMDIGVSYALETSTVGNFDFNINATYMWKYRNSVLPSQPLVTRLDRPRYPLDFRSRSNILWIPNDNISVSLYYNYNDKYYDDISRREISAHSTFDVTISYSLYIGSKASIPAHATIQLIVNNIFNNDPPFYENNLTSIGYDPSNSEPLGRYIALNATINW